MISAVILTKNEEKNIKDCLKSLSFCDEIIVVDDNSNDKTIEIIQKSKFKNQNEKSKIKIFQRTLNGDFSSQRNFALEKTKGEWVLFVDADERITPQLVSSIKYQVSSIRNNPFSGYKIRRIDFMWERQLKYGETGNINLLRLARKNVGRWKGKVHERWEIKGEVGQLQQPLFHYPHPTITEFLQEINYYTSLRAQELYEKGVKVHWWSVVLYPKTKFLLNFFLKRGFLDGVEGLLIALLMSFHSFLVRAKLWLLWKKQ